MSNKQHDMFLEQRLENAIEYYEKDFSTMANRIGIPEYKREVWIKEMVKLTLEYEDEMRWT